MRKRIHDLWVQTVLRKLAFSEPIVCLSFSLLQCPFHRFNSRMHTRSMQRLKAFGHSSTRRPKISAEMPRSWDISPEAIGRWVQQDVKNFCRGKGKSKFRISDSQGGCDFYHDDFFVCAELPGCFCPGCARAGTAKHWGWVLPWGSENKMLPMVCKSD